MTSSFLGCLMQVCILSLSLSLSTSTPRTCAHAHMHTHTFSAANVEGGQQHREQAWESNHGLWEGATEEGWSERDVRGEHLQGPVAPSHLSPPSISIKNDYSLFRSDLPPTSLSARFFLLTQPHLSNS